MFLDTPFSTLSNVLLAFHHPPPLKQKKEGKRGGGEKGKERKNLHNAKLKLCKAVKIVVVDAESLT